MATSVRIDCDLLSSEINETYAPVSDKPGLDFILPTGRAWYEVPDSAPELADIRAGSRQNDSRRPLML